MHLHTKHKLLRTALTVILTATLVLPAGPACAQAASAKQTAATAQTVAAKTAADKAEKAETAAKPEKSEKSDKSDKAGKKTKATIMLTGDLMCHPGQQQAAYDGNSYDFTPTFRYVKKLFGQADLVVGNLETLVSKSLPLSKDINYVQTRPYLNAPDSFLDALSYAGYDVLITANNHVCDGGEIGIRETLNALDAHGFAHTGSFRDQKEKRYVLANVNGIKVGILAYATYFNKKEQFLADGKAAYMLNLPTEERIAADVKALKKAGAEYIIAYNHCGTEYAQTPAARQRRYAKTLAGAGVDYVINSHPHVLQPFGKVKVDDAVYPVLYSMGNFVSGMADHKTKETIILSLTLQRDTDGEVSLQKQTYYPCYMLDTYADASFVLMPEDSRYNDGFLTKAPAALAKEMRTHFEHIREVVGRLY